MIGFLLSPLGRLLVGAIGIVAFLSLFALDQRHKGAASAVAKIEKANTDAVSKAHSIRSGSSAGRGVLDPNTID